MIGKYLDALAEAGEWEALDRVIEAQQWCPKYYINGLGSRCLRGHVEDRSDRDGRPNEAHGGIGVFRVNSAIEEAFNHVRGVGPQFDELVARFGMDRVVRAIKLRAGKWTRPYISEQLVVSPESSVTKP